MKRVFYLSGLLVISVLCGCVYEVPLAEEAAVPIDPALTGTWQKIPPEGEEVDPDESVAVLPFSKTEYVVVCTPSRNDVVLFVPGMHEAVFRAYPIEVRNHKLIQLEWLQPHANGGARYQVCRYTLNDGVLTVETLNRDLVSPEMADSKELRNAVLENQDNPELFVDPVCYRRFEQ